MSISLLSIKNPECSLLAALFCRTIFGASSVGVGLILSQHYCTALHCTALYFTVLYCTAQDSVLDLVVGAPYTGAETLQYGGAVLVHLGTRAGGGYTLDTAASRCPIT